MRDPNAEMAVVEPRVGVSGHRFWQVTGAVVALLLAVLVWSGCREVERSFGALVGAVYSVDVGPTISAPGGQWRARVLTKGFGVLGDWTSVEVRAATYGSPWRGVGGKYSYDATLRWADGTTLVVADSQQHQIDVPLSYGSRSRGAVSLLMAPLGSFLLTNFALVMGLAVLVAGLLSVIAMPSHSRRTRAIRVVKKMLACLREEDAWRAASFVLRSADMDRLEPLQDILARSDIALRCKAHQRARLSVSNPSPALKKPAYSVKVRFPKVAEWPATCYDFLVVCTDSGWRLALAPEDMIAAWTINPSQDE